MSSPVVKSDKRRPGTPDIIVMRHLVLKSQLIFQHSMMEGTPSEQTQSTQPPVFSKNGKAESPKPEMMAAWECSQSPCPDLVSGKVAQPGFVSRGLSCKPCLCTLYEGYDASLRSCALCEAPGQLAFDHTPIHLQCFRSKAFPRVVDFLPLTRPGLSSPPLQGQPFTDSTGHWLLSSMLP